MDITQKELNKVVIRPGFITLELDMGYDGFTDPQTHSLVTGSQYEIMETIRTHLYNLTQHGEQLREIPYKYVIYLYKISKERTYTIVMR